MNTHILVITFCLFSEIFSFTRCSWLVDNILLQDRWKPFVRNQLYETVWIILRKVLQELLWWGGVFSKTQSRMPRRVFTATYHVPSFLWTVTCLKHQSCGVQIWIWWTSFSILHPHIKGMLYRTLTNSCLTYIKCLQTQGPARCLNTARLLPAQIRVLY